VALEVLHDPLEPFVGRQLEPVVQLGEFAVDRLVAAAHLGEAEAVDGEPRGARRRAREQRRQRQLGDRRPHPVAETPKLIASMSVWPAAAKRCSTKDDSGARRKTPSRKLSPTRRERKRTP